MLHLLPIRLAITAFMAIAIAAYALGFAFGWISAVEAIDIVGLAWRSSVILALFALGTCLVIWRFVPHVQKLVFPYLGGEWTGQLTYVDQNTGLSHAKPVRARFNHNLFYLKILLESDESDSKTLVVHADPDRDFNAHKLYYVFFNERKEGASNPRSSYRGTAILQLEKDNCEHLSGSYFTENGGRGNLALKRATRNPRLKFWL